MTREEALVKALDALHVIGSAIAVRDHLKTPPKNQALLESLQKAALTDRQVVDMAMNTWEAIVLDVQPPLPGTTHFECGQPSDEI